MSLICWPRPASIGLGEQFAIEKILNTRPPLLPVRDPDVIISTVIGWRGGFKHASLRPTEEY